LTDLSPARSGIATDLSPALLEGRFTRTKRVNFNKKNKLIDVFKSGKGMSNEE